MNEPIRGEVTRNYYSSDYFTLPEDEPRRAPYPFPDDLTCPHCGRQNGNIRRKTFFRCWTCGTVIQALPETVMPMTPEMLERGTIKGGIKLLDRTCTACKREFKTRADKPKEVCQRCRQRHTDNKWREKHPERYKETQAKHQTIKREKAARKRELAKEFL